MAKRPTETESRGAKPTLTWDLFQRICAHVELTGAKYKSCEVNGVGYTAVNNAINQQAALGDLEWQELWDTSFSKYREGLIQEARSRAVDGWNEPIYHMGKLVGTVQKKSDRLLELMLIKQVPEFAPQSTITLRDERPGGGLDIFKELTLDAKRRIRDIMVQDLEEQRAKAAARAEVISSEKLLEGPEE